MSNFVMGTILGKDFAYAQVNANHNTSVFVTPVVMYAQVLVQNPFLKFFPMVKLNSLIAVALLCIYTYSYSFQILCYKYDYLDNMEQFRSLCGGQFFRG